MITDLNHTLDQWLRWLRLRRAFAWALRGLILGLALGLLLGVAGLLRAFLLREEFLALTAIAGLTAPLLAGLIAYLWPTGRLRAARYFDRVFRLEERVSTALELSREADSGELTRRQLQDAVTAARKVRPVHELPLRVRAPEASAMLLLALLIGLVWFRGEAWFRAAAQARAVQQAIAAQAGQVAQLIDQIEQNDALSDEQKRSLSAPLEAALNELNADPSLEGSVSILASTAEKLEALSDPQAQGMAQALQQAGEKLAAQEGSPLQGVGQDLAAGNAIRAASQLGDLNLSQLSPAETQGLADQLASTAQSLSATDPELAAELQKAAQALQSGDQAAAQQALQAAAKALAQSGQQVIFSQVAGQAAQQLQQGIGQVLAAGGGQPVPGAGPQAGQTEGTGQTGAGSGQGESGASPSNGGEAGSSPIPQNNGPGDGGQTSYEQIYAPSLLGGEGGPVVGLPPSGQDGDTLGQGPATPSEPGESLVPYNEVYAQYAEIMRQAIENGSIPLEFTEIIRSYFDSLRP